MWPIIYAVMMNSTLKWWKWAENLLWLLFERDIFNIFELWILPWNFHDPCELMKLWPIKKKAYMLRPSAAPHNYECSFFCLRIKQTKFLRTQNGDLFETKHRIIMGGILVHKHKHKSIVIYWNFIYIICSNFEQNRTKWKTNTKW